MKVNLNSERLFSVWKWRLTFCGYCVCIVIGLSHIWGVYCRFGRCCRCVLRLEGFEARLSRDVSIEHKRRLNANHQPSRHFSSDFKHSAKAQAPAKLNMPMLWWSIIERYDGIIVSFAYVRTIRLNSDLAPRKTILHQLSNQFKNETKRQRTFPSSGNVIENNPGLENAWLYSIWRRRDRFSTGGISISRSLKSTNWGHENQNSALRTAGASKAANIFWVHSVYLITFLCQMSNTIT